MKWMRPALNGISTGLCAAVLLVGVGQSSEAQGRGVLSPEDAKRIAEAAARPTPRTPSGKPDMSGAWSMPGPNRSERVQGPALGTVDNPVLKLSSDQEKKQDAANLERRKQNVAGRPEYKPEYQA